MRQCFKQRVCASFVCSMHFSSGLDPFFFFRRENQFVIPGMYALIVLTILFCTLQLVYLNVGLARYKPFPCCFKES